MSTYKSNISLRLSSGSDLKRDIPFESEPTAEILQLIESGFVVQVSTEATPIVEKAPTLLPDIPLATEVTVPKKLNSKQP